MRPLDRYLKDVRAFLPGDQADDIVNELAENLRARFDDRAAELGRDLTDDEQKAILQEHGKPLLVAARYRPEQSLTFGRQLIGPALFPSYIQVLKINLAITVIVVIAAAIVAASGQPLIASASSVALAILIQFGVVTVIFVAADRAVSGESSLPDDVARSLPGSLQRSLSDNLIGKDHPLSIPRRTSVADLALSAITLGWLAFVRPPNVTEVLRSGPGWESFWLPIVVVISITAIQPIVTFARPTLVNLRAIVRVMSDLALVATFALSMGTGQWIVPTEGAAASADVQTLASEINRWVGISLAIATAITVAMAALELYRLVGRLRGGGSMSRSSQSGAA